MQNETRVAVDSKPVREGSELRWKFELTLIDGENKIEVQSASADGSWESEPAMITFTRSQPTEKTELYLLAVGVSEYADESAGAFEQQRFAIFRCFFSNGEQLFWLELVPEGVRFYPDKSGFVFPFIILGHRVVAASWIDKYPAQKSVGMVLHRFDNRLVFRVEIQFDRLFG